MARFLHVALLGCRSATLLLPVLVLLPAIASADKVDDLVRTSMKKWGTPGVSVAVIHKGKVIKMKGYGYANIEHGAKVTPETIFQSGSVGKMFTASLVMKLVEDGKVKLDESIRTYLPDTPVAWEKVTVRHLLTHTGGLADPYAKLDMRKDYTEAELLKIEGESPLDFEPGEQWRYSNTGYHVLGFLCSKVGGRFYGDQLVDRVLRPAGMKTARIISEEDIVMHRSAGYEIVDGKPFNQAWVSPRLNTTGDGSLYVSLIDMVNWNAAMDGEKVLSEYAKKQMWTSVVLKDGTKPNYGFGWMTPIINGHKYVGHSGAWQGFRTSIRRFPDDHLAVIVLANSNSADPHKLSRQIAASYVPDLASVPPPAIRDTAPALTGTLVKLLDGDGSNALEMMTSEMKKGWTRELFDELLKELRSPGKRTLLVPTSVRSNGKTGTYRVRYGKVSQLITISLNEQGLIQGLGIEDED